MCIEEIEIFYVEVRERVGDCIVTDVRVGPDYERAVTEKDKMDMLWDDGSTYTVITSDFEETEE